MIECPACTTRYNIQVPESGRTVRCKKCAHVWRALPENDEPALRNQEYDGAIQAVTAALRKSHAISSEASDHTAETTIVEERAALNGRQGIGDTSLLKPDAPAISQPSTDIDKSEDKKVSWLNNFRKKADPAQPVADSDVAKPISSAAVIGTGLSQSRTASPVEHALVDPALVKEPILGEGGPETLEQAREAVRGVFSALSDSRASIPEHSYARPVLAGSTPSYQEEQPSDMETADVTPGASASQDRTHTGDNDVVQSEAANWSSDENSLKEAEESYQVAAQTEQREDWTDTYLNQTDGMARSILYADPSDDDLAASEDAKVIQAHRSIDEELEDPDAHLRSAFTRISQSRDFQDPQEGSVDEPNLHDGRLAKELESQLRHKPRGVTTGELSSDDTPAFLTRPAFPLEQIDREESRNGVESTPQDDTSYDARLYRELEETREHIKKPERGRGSLALAAAWGLFICAASGLIVGLFGFRENAVEQLPGLAPVYRALGMPVTVQPLLFENVQYRWDASGPKPAFLITGSVFNRAKRKVRIPDFYVAVKHRDTALDREYPVAFKTTNKKIKSGAREEFEIELVGLDPSVRAVELELRAVN